MKILIGGDYYPGNVADMYKIADALDEIKPICCASDYCIINYESPISSEYDSPIHKCGPCLKSSIEAAKALKLIGFDCVTLANNHVLDQGDKTLIQTIAKCKEIGFDIIGAGKDLNDAGKVLYKTINGETLAIINCCEHEFSIATENSPGANPLNPIRQYYAIKEARKKADYVLIIVHGGHEHYQLPSIRMKELYRYFIDCGADAVVNHHQHCYSGFEFYKEKPIIYGIGNFLFESINKQNSSWNEGYLVQLEFRLGQISFSLFPYYQCKGEFSVSLITDKSDFQTRINHLNKIIDNETLLKKSYKDWVAKNIATYKCACIPYKNSILRKAAMKGWIDNDPERSHALQLLNYILCEAHRDMFISFLNQYCR